MPVLDRVRNLFRRKAYQVPSSGSGGWYPIIREADTGFWQKNIEVNANTAATHYAVFSCTTLIARDIAKLGGPLLVARDSSSVWKPTENPAYSPVLRKPNHFQNRNQFWEQWILSKLNTGNTYVLKVRDNRRVVIGLNILNPRRVRPLVASDGSVFYECHTDELNGLPETVTVPASEIIHDRMNFLDHPLVGVPPIYASALAATQGLNIQAQSVRLFANNATPGGILTAPGHIEDDTAKRLKTDWEQRFSGPNIGRLAILGDGLKFEKMSLTAVEGQMIEQLKWTAETICSTFHVPPFKIYVGPVPSYDNVQALEQVYYSSALQTLIEDAETCLDEGLGLSANPDLGVEFPITNLLRMDTARQAEAVSALVGGSIMTPNEARLQFNLPRLEGGDTVYMQQQNYSLEALAKRDAQDDPFGTATPAGGDQTAGDLETLKQAFDAYGVGVRAGAITPQKDDEAHFRLAAGFPPPSPDVDEVWGDEPTRRPITLAAPGDGVPPPPVAPGEDDEPEEPDVDDEAAKGLANWHLQKSFDALLKAGVGDEA